MSQPRPPSPDLGATWAWPIDVTRYDRTVELRPAERQEIGRLLALRPKQQTPPIVARFVAAERLVRPLRDVTQSLHGPRQFGWDALIVILRWCLREERAFWGWGEEGWARLIGPNQARFCEAQGWPAKRSVRSPVIAAGYLLGQVIDFGRLGQFYRDQVAIKVFGRDLFEARALEVMDLLAGWGYRWLQASTVRNAAAELLLIHRSPRWQDVTAEALQRLHQDPATRKDRRYVFYTLSRALAAMGVIEAPLHHLEAHPNGIRERSAETAGIAPEWAELVTRWQQTSVLTPLVRKRVRLSLLRAGRWLGDKHPEVTRPGQWDRQLAAEFVAAMDHMRVGDYVWMRSLARGAGQPMSARTKAGYLGALRTFFHDVRDWGWADLRFDPGRVFATPRTWRALMGPEPRVIADDIWAKLLWAGLNLQPGDMVAAGASGGHHPGKRPRGPHEYYPFELVRALAMVWLFAGLRSDEIMRLRQGCARWQMASGGQGAGGSPAARRICLLDVPVNKTGPAFTKPVDALVGEAVQAWEGVRPDQPDLADPKTGELVPLLFCYRARRVAKRYLNQILIPRLCRKAGVPTSDARGSISSHRARATIASQLASARDPMSLVELQQWLGHRSPDTTRHYVAVAPTRLARAYRDAGYFARNVRAIEVLIDQEAIKERAAIQGQPWRYYDLGHGLCTYEFFERCPHRMACARCDFYVPKGSARGQLLESKQGLLRLIQEIPLSDEERAAVDGDMEALDRLVARLAQTPTPSGRAPSGALGLPDK